MSKSKSEKNATKADKKAKKAEKKARKLEALPRGNEEPSAPVDTTRLDDLEIKLAFVEKQLLDLNDVVKDLGDAIFDAASELRKLREQVDSSDQTGHDAEPPPHY